MNWNDRSHVPAIEASFNAMERRRRLKPILVAIVLLASFALAVMIAAVWAGSAPSPYAM